MAKNVVHELGHIFDNSLSWDKLGSDNQLHTIRPSNFSPYGNAHWIENRDTFLRPNEPDGYIDNQQHPLNMEPDGHTGGEAFGDTFLAWVYNAWNTNPANSQNVASAKTFIKGWALTP